MSLNFIGHGLANHAPESYRISIQKLVGLAGCCMQMDEFKNLTQDTEQIPQSTMVQTVFSFMQAQTKKKAIVQTENLPQRNKTFEKSITLTRITSQRFCTLHRETETE